MLRKAPQSLGGGEGHFNKYTYPGLLMKDAQQQKKNKACINLPVGTVRLSTPVDTLCVLPSLTMLDMTGIDS